MRKSFVVLALLVGVMAIWTTLAVAQDEGLKLMNARTAQAQLTRAARLGTSAASDTFWIGHSTASTETYNPFKVGVGPNRPGVGGSYNGAWDFDTYDGGNDSLQGWVATVSPNTRSAGTIADVLRPWQCLDWGNRINVGPVQGRTMGVVSAWHVDAGISVGTGTWKPAWSALAGSRSAWCGLRAGNDNSYVDDGYRGGTGNPYNGEAVVGVIGDGVNNTQHAFPGYMNQWDQMLYRDVRVADGGALTVSFNYESFMDPRPNAAEVSCKGWFDRDPLSMTEGPPRGPGPANFISASNYLGATARSGPVDSFMVYVGVPTDPTACQYSDGLVARPIFDLKRRWFSEVIAVDQPYHEILSTFGFDSTYRSTVYTVSLANGVIQPMLDATAGINGIVRVVFRVKTNANFSDETGTGGSMTTYGMGGVRVDNVAIAGALGGTVNSGFESTLDIDNRIEAANSSATPSVGQGYALTYWHATGKPPKFMVHTHPLAGGDIGGGNVYAPLVYEDMCGSPDSGIRQCNIHNVVISSTDHDLGEAAGGALGTPFKENRTGFMSPTINLVTPAVGTNDIGLDRVHATSNADWLFWYDIYTGIFNVTTQGNVWGNSVLSWPAVQNNGATVWGDIGFLTGVWYNPDKQCFIMTDLVKPNIYTSNESGMPDSMKLWIFREQRCISWGVTTGCSPTDGHYTDNVSLCIPPQLGTASDKISVDIWDWYGDAFPANETAGLPGTAAFDTCGAHIMTARNQSIATGNTLRFDVPGDSIYVKTDNTGGDARLDFVFRIYPGPGNYVIAGNKASGLRKVPQNAAAAVSGDASFFGQYLANAGEFSSGAHGASWNVNVWNNARCDTVELNIFPVEGKGGNLPGIAVDQYMTTLHESDPHFATLGILKNRCFIVDTLGGTPNNSLNITCSSVPDWLTDPAYAARAGYDGNQQTKEYTKIIPDGLLTAGSSVQYFFRMSKLATPTTNVVFDPDTNRITPQVIGSASNFDAKRWESIAILPDRWKDAVYGGLGTACMLVADYNDRRGDEKVWVGAMDTVGGTLAAKYGAHNGWHATAAYVAPDGTHDFTGEIVTNDANICVYTNGGLAGTTWDLYNIHAAESSNTGSAQLGSRLANRADMGLMTGKYDRHGPTPEMLRTYYKILFLMSGDLNTSFFGAATDRGQDDIALVTNFLTYGANPSNPRGLWAMGHGFVEGNTAIDAPHTDFLTNILAVSLRDPSYFALSGATARFVDLVPTSVVLPATHTGAIYAIENSCLFTNDVVLVNAGVSGATAGAYYQNLGANGPYVSSVYAPSTTGHPFISLLSGWDMWNMFSRRGGNTVGRLEYFMDVSTKVFGSICSFTGTPTIDVPQNTAQTVNFLGNIWGNPMVAGGKAVVRFGLARTDRVQVKVYDVTGRLVRTLADRNFPAGEQSLTWDGTNDQGQVVSRGVYFTQVKYINSRFEDAKKVTVLK